MTLEDLRRAAALLPPTASLSIPVAELRAALGESTDRDVSIMIASEGASAEPETWMTADECGALLNVSARWCYDHGAVLGARRLSRRCVRFSSRAVNRYLARTKERHG